MKKILVLIVLAQFFCTSLWFAGNAVLPDLIATQHFSVSILGNLTSAVQFGFIIGTLIFAVLAIADRYPPSTVFFISAILAALFNLALTVTDLSPVALLSFRFLTGFFLAGIYPIGMKIASDYFQKGLGKSLGFLVGALVLGTAFPHLLKSITLHFPWTYVVYATSLLSVIGGLTIYIFVPDGPHRKTAPVLKLSSAVQSFKNTSFRAAAFGYFGHMWELYAFWAFVPVMLTAYNLRYPSSNLSVSFYSFLIIGSGSIACMFSGLLSQTFDTKKIAFVALLLSALCCVLSPLFLYIPSEATFLAFLFFWAFVVIADSPLFSSLVAQHAPKSFRGSALTIVNCIGFSITIISIQCINILSQTSAKEYVYMFLAVGPVVGLVALLRQN